METKAARCPVGDETDAPAILIVDDFKLNRELLLRRLACDPAHVWQAENGQIALDMLREREFDLVLLDVRMPVLDGYDTLRAIREDPALRATPVIMITADEEVDCAVRCLDMGADDYFAKTMDPGLLRARVHAVVERKRTLLASEGRSQEMERRNGHLQERLQDQTRQLLDTQMAAIFAMSKLAESKDPDTGAHLDRMREYCVILSRELAGTSQYRDLLDDTFHDNLYAASALHDIGKVGIPDRILLKDCDLSPEEWVMMKNHTLIGGDTLRAVDREFPGNRFIRLGIEIAECHHERWDGNGYPHGLKGEEIPLSARILALGDMYDALTSKRCYKQAYSHQQSRAMIVEEYADCFDPVVLQAFLDREAEFIRVRRFFQDPDDA